MAGGVAVGARAAGDGDVGSLTLNTLRQAIDNCHAGGSKRPGG